MVQVLSLHYNSRENAQQSLRLLKKSGISAKLSTETTLRSEEMVSGTISSLLAYIESLTPVNEEEELAVDMAFSIVTLEEEAFNRIISAIREDGGSYLRRAYEEFEVLSEEERESLTQDAFRVLIYAEKGLIEETDEKIVILKDIDARDHTVLVPALLLLFPDKEELKSAHLNGEKIVSSETIYSIQTGMDVIFCPDPPELIDSLQDYKPEEDSFIAYLEQFFLLITLADVIVREIEDGAVFVHDIAMKLSSISVSIDEESYPIRFDIAFETVQQMVDALRSGGRIAGKDGRLKVR